MRVLQNLNPQPTCRLSRAQSDRAKDFESYIAFKQLTTNNNRCTKDQGKKPKRQKIILKKVKKEGGEWGKKGKKGKQKG